MQCTIQLVHYNREINIEFSTKIITTTKTIRIMETIITVATILSMYLNVSLDSNSQYFYNADIENGQLTTMYVYDRMGESLCPKLEYRYTYDDAERVTTKEAFAWNKMTNEWQQSYKLDFRYTADGYTVERSNWDSKANAYKTADQKAVYKYEFDHLMSVNYLQLDHESNTFNLVDQMLVMNPKNDLLLAWE